MFGLPRIKLIKGHGEFKLYLPWKILGHDGHPHQATLKVEYYHTQSEDMMESARNYQIQEVLRKEREFEKKVKGGLRRCPGHKNMTPLANGTQCGRCGGWVY